MPELCLLCMQRRPDVRLQCGHLYACVDCIKLNIRCGICREPISIVTSVWDVRACSCCGNAKAQEFLQCCNSGVCYRCLERIEVCPLCSAEVELKSSISSGSAFDRSGFLSSGENTYLVSPAAASAHHSRVVSIAASSQSMSHDADVEPCFFRNCIGNAVWFFCCSKCRGPGISGRYMLCDGCARHWCCPYCACTPLHSDFKPDPDLSPSKVIDFSHDSSTGMAEASGVSKLLVLFDLNDSWISRPRRCTDLKDGDTAGTRDHLHHRFGPKALLEWILSVKCEIGVCTTQFGQESLEAAAQVLKRTCNASEIYMLASNHQCLLQFALGHTKVRARLFDQVHCEINPVDDFLCPFAFNLDAIQEASGFRRSHMLVISNCDEKCRLCKDRWLSGRDTPEAQAMRLGGYDKMQFDYITSVIQECLLLPNYWRSGRAAT